MTLLLIQEQCHQNGVVLIFVDLSPLQHVCTVYLGVEDLTKNRSRESILDPSVTKFAPKIRKWQKTICVCMTPSLLELE